MTSKRNRWLTLEEHDAQLKAEGRYDEVKERLQRQEEIRQKLAAANRVAEEPLVRELNEAGFEVGSVWDLVNTKAPYPFAIPILLHHLMRPYPERVREGIARALAVPEARVGWKTLVEAFKRETDTSTIGVKWALALALGATGTDETLDDVIPLLRDKSLGENRSPLLAILARSKDPRAFDLLRQLAEDKDIAHDIKKILRKLKPRKPDGKTKAAKYAN